MMPRQFPHYTHIPGVTPHPIRDPAGHMYSGNVEQHANSNIGGEEGDRHDALSTYSLIVSLQFQWAVRLFNAGFYWEAHEAWEGLWHLAGRVGPLADFLKAFIKLAAAGVKLREWNPEGVRRHAMRAVELFRGLDGSAPPEVMEFAKPLLKCLIDWSSKLAETPPPFPEDRSGQPVPALGELPIAV